MRLIAFILLFLPFAAFSQVNGTYCLTSDYTSTCITLSNNGKFKSKHSSCLEDISGMGHYKLTKDSLTLNYEQDPKQDRGEIKIETSQAKRKDSIQINFIVSDSISPLYACKIYIGGISTKTDIDGVVKVMLPLSSNEQTIEITYISYDTIICQLTPDRDFKINVRLAKEYHGIKANKKSSYAIKWLHSGDFEFCLGRFDHFHKESK